MRSDCIDVTGKRFGMLVAVEYAGTSKYQCAAWKCQCDCGNTRIVRSYDLRAGKVVSCGCRKAGPRKDMTGYKFGEWTVIGLSGSIDKRRGHLWTCECSCGTKRNFPRTYILNGGSKSCSCKRPLPFGRKRRTSPPDPILQSLKNRWSGIKERCYNPKIKAYKNYGGRGITVCDEWINNFEAFCEWSKNNGFRIDLELDRIDNDKGYSPDNCRYVTHKENNRNRRNNRNITFNGETKTLSEWCEEMGECLDTIGGRITRGWSIERALTEPVNKALSRPGKRSKTV